MNRSDHYNSVESESFVVSGIELAILCFISQQQIDNSKGSKSSTVCNQNLVFVSPGLSHKASAIRDMR
eukprot:scaffold113616_cov22-Prasinocladus_malaysianus.AAC.1